MPRKGQDSSPLMPNGIDSPVEAYAKLHISKRLVGTGGSPMILGNWLGFNIPLILDNVRWEPVFTGSGIRAQSRFGSQGQGSGRNQKVSSIHRHVSGRSSSISGANARAF